MSNKAQRFAGVITNPMNVFNFEINIPGVNSNCTLVVESTTYPQQGKFRTISLWYQGEQVRYPGLPENGGEWTVRIPESDDGKILKAFHELSSVRYNQKTGVMSPVKFNDITLVMKDLQGNEVYHVVLHGCWINSRNNVNLSAQQAGDSWKWDFVFTYQWIEDVLGNNKGAESPM